MTAYGDTLPKGMTLPELEGVGNDYSFLEKRAQRSNPQIPISIVLPVYNRIDMLRRTMAMLTHQTYPLKLMEIIIADDGSNDHPEQLILEFEDFFDVNYVRQKDLGYRLSHVRNLGVRAAKYDNIIILDCDMAPVPNLVELYAKWLSLDEKVLLIGHRRYVDANDVTIESVMTNPSVMLELPPVATKNAVMRNSPSRDWREAIYNETDNLRQSPHPFRVSSCGNVAFHRRIFSDAGPFDEAFTAWGAEDNEFGYRVMNAGYYFIPILDALGLHQEPPGGREFVDREAGKLVTRPMLLDMVPTYRDYDPDVQSTTPMVSVFFPVINAIDSIEKTINSVLNQSYRDFDIVICDFGSTDGTRELLTDVYGENSRIMILQEENIGISAASNICIENASGMYLLQLEEGDQLEPNTIENLLPVIDSSPGNSCVYGNSGNDDLGTSKFNRIDLLTQMFLGKPRLFRKRDWSRVNGFSEEYHLAYNHDFFLKLSEVGEFVQVKNRLFSSSQHTLHASLGGFNQDLEETRRIVQQALSRQGIPEWEVHTRNFLTGKIGITLTKKGSSLVSQGPFLSVVIITRNRSELLSDAVRSTLNQSYENFELIVIDDGSTDDTVVTIQSFNDARIRLISTEQSGIPKSRNLGVRMSKGEYVVIMDDDDLMLPNRLQEHVNCLTPGSAGSYGGWVDQNSEMEHEYNPGAPHGYSEILFGGKVMLHPASMIKRNILLEFPYDENYSFGTDYVMNLEIARAGHRLNHTGSYILLRRFHGGNVTITNAGEQKNTARVRVKEFLQELDEDTKKKMRAEWKSRKHFNDTPKPTSVDFDLFFPWLSLQNSTPNLSTEQVVMTQNSLNKSVDNYSVEKRWKQKRDVLIFDSGQREISFRMPKGWKINNTHPDLFRISHYYLCSPWEGGILDGWIPSREKGWRPGLAFSGGVDSAACMALMPPETLLFYHQREGFESNLDHSNAFRFINKLRADGKQVVITESDHELIRTDFEKSPGFSTDIAGAVHVILLADYFELGGVVMGMPLENAYLFHGHKGRNFNDSSYWKTHSKILQRAGLDLILPTAGASEIINQAIVEQSPYDDYSESCLRSSEEGKVCGRCWKCFRKNSLKGKAVSIQGEIEVFLRKRPLKQAISTLYAIQRLPIPQQELIKQQCPDLVELLEEDFSLIERYYTKSLEIIPERYRKQTLEKLNEVSKPMSESECEALLSMNLFQS
tara:strand:+ start:766 stop:4398 length:3633 start_codon:yes stop_codon:yes gene_type:complete